MAMVLEHDHETFNEAELKKVGLDLYMTDPSAEHLMTSWRVYDDADEPPPFELWDKADTDTIPTELAEALVDPHVEKWAFNAAFERRAARDILDLDTPYEGWRCAMYLAYMHSFSGKLEDVGAQMFLPEDEVKKKDGKKLIDLFCKPQKLTKANQYRRRNWDTNPDEWDVFREYCLFDSISEYGIKKRLIKFPIGPDEWRLYEMDQVINDRGLPIDREFVESAILLSDQRKREIISLMTDLTGLDNPNSPTQLMGWLKDQGYDQNDLQKDTIKKVLRTYDAFHKGEWVDEMPTITEIGVQGLKYRQQSARLSVRKYTAIKNRLANDDHIRHVFQIGGASRTIRWAGRGFQPQNLTSTPKEFEPKGDDASLLTILTDTIREGNLPALHLMVDEPMDALAGCVRSSVRALDDMEMVCCDLSSIESVVIGWLCGCERLLNVFRNGKDAYKDFATEFYGISYDEVTSEQRKICKPPTLGCGFGLGGGDLRDGKRTGLWGYAEKMGVDMTRDVSHAAVRLWRDTYEEIVHYWYAIERTVISVVEDGRTRTCGPITVKLMKPYLVMFLPDGAPRYYYKPKIWHEERVGRTGRPYVKKNFTHMGKEQKTGRWIRMSSRGAKLVENLVQSIARQILKAGLMRAFDDGFDLRGHVHDELISLRPANSNYYTVERLIEHMITANDDYIGMPLNAAGWAGVFYRK
jgi:DNA polymerase